MTLIVGGRGQGKLAYVLERTGLTALDVATDPVQGEGKPIFNHLEAWVKTHPGGDLTRLLAQNPDVIVICDEVGCGVVPVDKGERAWREEVGRLCCHLAREAQRVERVFCGLPMILKGDGPWKSC